eukprot:TRINITY_DN166_c0_g1_i1.p1 TRINITY_DN166_c0_g1~~TRINITY_DN166_c0_g1_i1.p1  ORF type:complete len:214 (-),score=52.13 TRINITY_DN166_c0_g1_i1:142-783(-)
MVKHNNIVPYSHFHKKWDERVRTWFDQPGKKRTRALRRAAKAAAVFPRPAHGLLRPVVRCPTLKYNMKKRLGKGFSIAELKAAGVPRAQAMTIGISVDSRRRNKSEEGFQENVQLLKKYKANLILFPRRKTKLRKGDATAEEISKADQFKGRQQAPKKSFERIKAQKVEQDKTTSFTKLRRARADARLVGKRKVRAEKAAAAAKEKEAKAAAK